MQTAPQVEGLEALAPENQQGVGAALAAVLGGYRARDADRVEGWHADDADWVNAFGSHKVGDGEIRGRRLVGGGAIEVRDNTSLRVPVRGADSAWRIVSELFSDANTQQSFAGHS